VILIVRKPDQGTCKKIVKTITNNSNNLKDPTFSSRAAEVLKIQMEYKITVPDPKIDNSLDNKDSDIYWLI